MYGEYENSDAFIFESCDVVGTPEQLENLFFEETKTIYVVFHRKERFIIAKHNRFAKIIIINLNLVNDTDEPDPVILENFCDGNNMMSMSASISFFTMIIEKKLFTQGYLERFIIFSSIIENNTGKDIPSICYGDGIMENFFLCRKDNLTHIICVYNSRPCYLTFFNNTDIPDEHKSSVIQVHNIDDVDDIIEDDVIVIHQNNLYSEIDEMIKKHIEAEIQTAYLVNNPKVMDGLISMKYLKELEDEKYVTLGKWDQGSSSQ